jgi:hypothetical protein
MSEKKNWGQSVLGWFVVKEETGSTSDVDAVLAEIRAGKGGPPPAGLLETPPAEAPSEPGPAVAIKDLPSAAAGVDFVKVFEAFGVDQQERDLWQRASDLVKSLPVMTDPVIKKQIVEASLKAFGIPIDKIIESGVEQIQALDGYQKGKAQETAGLQTDALKQIADHEEQIRQIRSIMQDAVTEQETVQSTCNTKKLEVQSVLEFFGIEAVQKVVRDSPKLIDPSAPPAAPEKL